jgi:SET domain-containing protein
MTVLVVVLLLLLLPSAATTLAPTTGTTGVLGIRPTLCSKSLAHSSALKADIHIRVASKEKGLGAFATSDIKFGTYIGEYLGEILTRQEVQARHWGKRTPDEHDKLWAQSRRDRGQGITGNYVFEMQDGSFVDAEDADMSGWCRFMNHASNETHQCNVRPFDKIDIDGEFETFPQFYAIRDIQEGEELSFDYGPLSWYKND